MKRWTFGLGALLLTITASVFLIVMGLIYFIFTLWIVKIGSNLLGYGANLSADFAVLAAALIAVGSMIGSALQR